jgi:diguanylate cyclase (GGDEF)-like protein/PAS domain S-box-containing protein
VSSNKRIARYFVVCAALAIPGVIDPSGPGGGLVVLWSVVCAGLVIARAVAPRPSGPSILPLLASTGGLMTTGIIIRGIHGAATGELFPYPSPADIVHFPAYILLLLTLVQLHRHRSTERDVDAWLDGAVLAQAVSIVAWLWFYGDFVQNNAIPLPTRLINAPYDLVLLISVMLLLRITATPGRRPHAYHLLGVGVGALLIVDFASAISLAEGAGLSVTVGLSPFVSGFTLAAVRHPSIHEMFREQEQREFRVGKLRLSLLTGTILSPALIAWFGGFESTLDAAVLVGLSTMQACTVTVRVIRLLRSQQEAAHLERILAAQLSFIANLRSVPEISEQVPRSARMLAPDGAWVRLGHSTTNTKLEIPIPDVLCAAGGDDKLLISGAPVDERSKRLISTLVRDAGLVASSIESRADDERRASQEEANRRIAANEQRFRALVQNASDVVFVIDHSGIVTYASDAAERVLGYPVEDFMGHSLEWAAHENDWDAAREYVESFLTGTSSRQEHEIRALHADGSIRLLECILTDMSHVESVGGIVINVTDSTDKRMLESNLRDAETTDPLTMQLNRTAFIREVDSAIRRASVSAASVALAIINIDDFRMINEGYGTSIADQVLIDMAHRIRQSVRIGDVVARLNGDEFGILMPSGYSTIEAEQFVQRVLEGISEPLTVNGRAITLRATAGLVLDTDGDATGIEMLRDADTALDAAKQSARGGVVLFEESMGQAISERVELRNLLREAIQDNHLRLVFQPIIDMKTGKIVSMEALSRWHHKGRGNIGPSTFIPIAESAGMIQELGEWALRTACTHVVEWASQGIDGFTVSVNMSAHQLREENVIAKVKAILDQTGVDPSRITIEITESVLIDDTDFIAERIRKLRELGLSLAIDDFGTGYSSLSYLRRYEFDVLKIDRSFVIPLADGANIREREIVNAMIKLAQALGAVTVAEGIEEPEESDVLQSLGCDRAQGYLFWHPLEIENVLDALASAPALAA